MKPKVNNAFSTVQDNFPLDPSEGSGTPNAGTAGLGPNVGLNVVMGKNPSTQSMPIWDRKTDFTQTAGDGGATDVVTPGSVQSYSTDEKATWKNAITSEGLPQTWSTNTLADHTPRYEGPASNDSQPDQEADILGSQMPQTSATRFSGGAPTFKPYKA